ncbi:MAG: hypothetical protein K5Q00_04235 [Gammaproteobacteria bacterium]|nr:hypothetical protein [Gammaproteobacteria bacterium]
MFAVIYRFNLQPHQEAAYIHSWNAVADYFIAHCNAIGSCLHKGSDGLWVAYSRWPDKATRDAAWPGDKTPSDKLPAKVRDAIKTIQQIKTENIDLPQYEDIYLDVVADKLQ